MYLCVCNAITREDACGLALNGACNRAEIASRLGLDREDACGRCIRNIERFMIKAAEQAPDAPRAWTELTATAPA